MAKEDLNLEGLSEEQQKALVRLQALAIGIAARAQAAGKYNAADSARKAGVDITRSMTGQKDNDSGDQK
jgi:hypothetical protein